MKLKYKCKYCELTFIKKDELYKHKRDIHNITDNNGKQPYYNLTCDYCGLTKYTTKGSMNNHKSHCIQNPNRIKYKGHKLSEETKRKISIGMHNAALEGRNKGWTTTKSGPQHKSYPEVFFTKIIENEFNDKNYEYNLPFYTWKLDFAWVHKKLCIEIDGSQHENEIQANSDLRKDKKLIEEGWKVLRIKWLDIFHNTQDYIKQAKDFIDTGVIVEYKPYINPIKEKVKKEKIKKEKIKKEKVKKEKPVKICNYLKDNSNRYNCMVLSSEIWEERKNKILNSNVDLKKFGWITKVSKITGLTKRVIEKTVEHFKDLQNMVFTKQIAKEVPI